MVTELLPILFAATEGAAHEESAGIAALGIDPLAVLAQAVTFLLLFWVIKKFALDKIVASLEERRKTIDKGVRLGFEMQAEKDQLEANVEKQLQLARTEADKILAGAHQEAGSIVKQAEATASEKVETMLQDAEARISDEVAKAKKQLEKEVVSLVAEATEIVIGEKLDDKKDSVLIERALSGVSRR